MLTLREIKRTVSSRKVNKGIRQATRPIDDGILAVPITSDKREAANREMKSFIKLHKKT